MTKEMEELLSKKTEILNRCESLKKEKNYAGLKDSTAELTSINDEIKALETYENSLKEVVDTKATNKANGFKVMAKMLNRQVLNEGEKQLISGINATQGENYLIPEDVRLEINELRKSYVSAKELLTVVQTTTLSGSFNYEKGGAAGLVDFEDGAAIDEKDAPEFVKKTFTIGFAGKLLPVSRILIGAEKAQLMSYINRWFVKNAIVTENKAVFTELAKDKTAKTLADFKALRKSMLKDLDPSVWSDGVIVTNQSGFAALDESVDTTGRPILYVDPADPTRKLFNGVEVVVFPDTILANISSTTAPVFYGSLKAGGTFVDYDSLEFATSSEYGFNKNQNYLRVIEGFDVVGGDKDAYAYGALTISA